MSRYTDAVGEGRCLSVATNLSKTDCELNRRVSRTFDAPEWTRTTTRETPDKALNLVQKV